jgi:hypothetical protein
MTDTPAPQEMENAVAALIPFVKRWNLSLNPEDLYEIAGAVLSHAHSSASYEEIAKAVEGQLDDYAARMRGLNDD